MTYYLNLSPNESGAYPPPQDRPGDGLIRISEEQRDMVIQYGGFVKVEENRQPDGCRFCIRVKNIRRNLSSNCFRGTDKSADR